MKEIKIILSQEAKEVFDYLNIQSEFSKTERSILRALRQKAELIKQTPHMATPFLKN